MSYLELNQVCKAYGAGTNRASVLEGVNLHIEEGEFIAIVGFSGSGKTTLINTIAGLTTPDSGEVLLGGERITGPGPERGMVFQSYSLLPWLTVYGNIALAVDQTFKDWPAARRRAHVEKYVELVNLTPALDKRPAELSGGMRQRVAVARALAISPKVLLLDEPLSALDALTRANLQDEIERIWRVERKTVLLITNDVDEAILLADRIIPLTPGPGARLGREFKVDLPRPRDRVGMNHDPAFKALRRDVTRYLMGLAEHQAALAAEETRLLPAMLPNTHHTFDKPSKLVLARRKGATEAPRRGDDQYVSMWNLSKVFPTPKGPVAVVEDFNLNIKKGEFVSIIGHSGCGKSTVLSMVAGLSPLSGGGIILDQKEVVAAGPDRGIVFQAPSLFPWMSAYENVMLGVDQVYRHATKAERADMAKYYLERVGLGAAMDKRAADLSNGMRQRVGIARAFALSPKLLLLDEPFGMLDSLTRWDLQEVLMEVWTRTRVTGIMITHDVDEAILLADRVVMMTNGPRAKVGEIMEVDLPRPRTRAELLEHPDYYRYRERLIGFLEGCDKNHAKPGSGKAAAPAPRATPTPSPTPEAPAPAAPNLLRRAG